MSKTLEHEVKPPDSLYWSNVLRERDVIKGQLDAMEESLAEKDVRIAELEREAVHLRVDTLRAKRATDYLSSNAHRIPNVRPGATLDDAVHDSIEALVDERDQLRAELERSRSVGDWPEARRLREAWASESREWFRSAIYSQDPLHAALRAFCESAPPASAPSDEAAHYKAVAQQNAAALTECQKERDRMHLTMRDAQGERDFAQASLAERTRQVAQLQEDLCDARYARDKAQAELAALKSSPRYVQATVETMLGYHVAEWQDLLSWVELYSNPLFGEKVGLVELAKRAAHGYVASALKSAPVRFEREVDAELADALRSWRAWYQSAPAGSEAGIAGTNARMALARASKLWLAAPLSAPEGEKAAPRISPEERAKRAPPPPETLVGALQDRVCETSGRLISATPIKTAPADGERVLECWVREYEDRGCVFGYTSAREALQGGRDCRAHRVAVPILETVVREGGAS